MHPPPPPPLTFPTLDALAAFLKPRLPRSVLSSWGVAPGTKPLLNLFHELSTGDSSLLPTSPPIRAVHVATVHLLNSRGAHLLETHQLLSDGSHRHRGRPLAEKMRPGEKLEDAVARAVREELGSGVRVRVLEGSGEVRVEEKDSASYPGLNAKYVLHSVKARVVEGVPEEGEFETEENGEKEEVGEEALVVKRHFWKWVDNVDADVN